MIRLRAAFALLVLCLGCSSFADLVPDMLIVQMKSKDIENNVPMADALAQEFDDQGKVHPIVWSLSDPFFRAAVNDGIIKNPAEYPSVGDAKKAASKLKIPYILIVTSAAKDGQLYATLDLLRNGRGVWSDKQQTAVTLSLNFDTSNSVLSVAHTWVLKIGAGPLKDLPAQPKAKTPEVEPGQLPKAPVDTNPTVAPTPAPPQDDKEFLDSVSKMLSQGHFAQAVGILRDGVDQQPLNYLRRKALAEALLQSGMPKMAALESRRASELMPDHPDLRAIAARAWMQAGLPEEAQKDLNEAVARDPNSPETRGLLAEIALQDLKPEEALEHLKAALSKSSTFPLLQRKALADALLGNDDALTADLSECAKIPDQLSQGDYVFAADVLSRAVISSGDDLRSLVNLARAKPGDQQAKDWAAASLAIIKTRTRLLSSLVAPERFKRSHDRRLLAFNLLIQSLTDLNSYLKDGGNDVLDDAQMNLGESLKQLASAMQQFQSESNGDGNSSGTG